VTATTAPQPGTITLLDRDGGRVLRLSGEVDSATVLAHRGTHPPVTDFDVSGVTFLDCAGLRFLAGHFEASRRAGHRPALHAAPRPVRRLVELTGAEPLFR
jgi:anti-anti-sigma factor